MKETSKEARPAKYSRETQVNEIIQCISYYGALSRKQVAELTGLEYVCQFVRESLKTFIRIQEQEQKEILFLQLSGKR